MERITSFSIDHTRLKPGLYVSRLDSFGGVEATTFDLRLKTPNGGEYLTTAASHTFEHLGATFLRNDPEFKTKTIYFGPMGCRTGFYAVFFGIYDSEGMSQLFVDMCSFIESFEGEVPGTKEAECGNCADHDLIKVKAEASAYKSVLESLSEETSQYPV